MPVHAPRPAPPGSLDAIVLRAGGRRAPRDGHLVVTSYGSAAGELAACVTAVGLADRSQMIKLQLGGPVASLRALTSALTGTSLAPGGAARAGGAWWCVDEAGRTIVLCEPPSASRLRAAITRETPRHPGVQLMDHTADWAALAVVGRRAPELLARLGVHGPAGNPREVAPVRGHRCDGVAATWLLQADDTAWAVLPGAAAPRLWGVIERAGRPLGLCAVGQEALARYALLRRAAF